MKGLMQKFIRGLLAVGIAAALAFGGVEALTTSGATVQDCPNPCENDLECELCCPAGGICPAPGEGECLCA